LAILGQQGYTGEERLVVNLMNGKILAGSSQNLLRRPEQISKLEATLSNGSAEDYSHYRQIVGSISGLEWARDNLIDIVKKRIYTEDD
jgi:hypothetical protein